MYSGLHPVAISALMVFELHYCSKVWDQIGFIFKDLKQMNSFLPEIN